MKKIAIIDMGTNTFNLLVASVNGDSSYKIIHSSKQAVKLGEGGINQKFIAPAAYQRGLNAIGEHMRTILLHGANEIFAFATSATRNASNGHELVADIKNLFGVEVKVIDGEEETELIYFGIRQAVELNSQNVLMLDIGGGSNEIIIGNANQYHWKKSYDLGISRLLQKFNPSDPILENEIAAVEEYLETQLSDLVKPMEQFKPKMIIGSSGSFDTYRNVLVEANILSANGDPSLNIPMEEYFKLHNRLVKTTTKERAAIPGMDPMRVEMIVLATIFTHYLVRRFDIQSMVQSSYALKEGAIWKMISGM